MKKIIEITKKPEKRYGWLVDYVQLEKVAELAKTLEDGLSLEQVEAVMLAMIDLGFAKGKFCD